MRRADLEPIDAAPGRLVEACFSLEHLDHQTLTAIFDALVQECLDVFRLLTVRRFGKLKLKLDWLKMLSQKLSPFCQVFSQQWLHLADQYHTMPYVQWRLLTSPLR